MAHIHSLYNEDAVANTLDLQRTAFSLVSLLNQRTNIHSTQHTQVWPSQLFPARILIPGSNRYFERAKF